MNGDFSNLENLGGGKNAVEPGQAEAFFNGPQTGTSHHNDPGAATAGAELRQKQREIPPLGRRKGKACSSGEISCIFNGPRDTDRQKGGIGHLTYFTGNGGETIIPGACGWEGGRVWGVFFGG